MVGASVLFFFQCVTAVSAYVCDQTSTIHSFSGRFLTVKRKELPFVLTLQRNYWIKQLTLFFRFKFTVYRSEQLFFVYQPQIEFIHPMRDNPTKLDRLIVAKNNRRNSMHFVHLKWMLFVKSIAIECTSKEKQNHQRAKINRIRFKCENFAAKKRENQNST